MTLLGVVTGMGGIVCFQGRIVGCVYGRNTRQFCVLSRWTGEVWQRRLDGEYLWEKTRYMHSFLEHSLVRIPKDGSVNKKGAEGKMQAAARWS